MFENNDKERINFLNEQIENLREKNDNQRKIIEGQQDTLIKLKHEISHQLEVISLLKLRIEELKNENT